MRTLSKTQKLLLAAAGLCPLLTAAGAGISDLRAEYRHGQVFLQWREENLPAAARLRIWCAETPLTPEKVLTLAPSADRLNPGSATDWWCRPACFVRPRSQELKAEEIFAGSTAEETAAATSGPGFTIAAGGRTAIPGHGLHVHTVKKAGSYFFAAGWYRPGGKKPEQVLCLTEPVTVQVQTIAPIALYPDSPGAGAGRNRPLIVELHGRGGGVGVDGLGKPVGNFIFYADDTLAWREGIPYKFTVTVTPEAVRLRLNDRTWIGRPLTPAESPDTRDGVPAINSFWLGYNRNIGVSNLGPDFQVDNYTERLVLHLVRWAQQYLGCDVNRTYISGGSMGGTGAVQLATHFPGVFAAVRALVPVYSYSWRTSPGGRPGPSAERLVCSCGFFTAANPAHLPDGRELLAYASGEKNIADSAVDMPPIFATNGRRDMSIPWVNNPPFYRAANRARQAFCVFWNNGDHGMSEARPADMAYPDALLFQYRLNQVFPAFSECSADRNCGGGDSGDGDETGWINRGLGWQAGADTPERLSLTLTAAYPGISYPVTCLVTFRRIQQFRVRPGEKLRLSVNGTVTHYTVPADGLLTVPVKFTGGTGVTVEFTRQ